MNQVELKLAGIHYDEGVQRFAGKQDLYEKYLLQFESDTYFQQLKQAFAAENLHLALFYAHTLKGQTALLSIQCLYERFANLVKALSAPGGLSTGEALLPDLEQNFDKIIRILARQKQN